jgi:hypothetical protein
MENQITFTPPRVFIKENGYIQLTSDWTVNYGKYSFTVQKGFISDGNSVPSPLPFFIGSNLFVLLTILSFIGSYWILLIIFAFLAFLLMIACFIPKFGRNTIAGIAHDWLYYTGKMELEGKLVAITQRQADVVRLDLCNYCGVIWVQRMVSYIGLRMGGWTSWRKARRF